MNYRQHAKVSCLFLWRGTKPTNEAAFITPALTEREIDDVCGKLAAAGVDILGKIRVLADQ